MPHHPGRDFRDGPDDDFGALLRQDWVDRLRDQQANDPRARPRRSHAREVGGAGIALRSRQDHDRPKGPLVAITRAGGEPESIGEDTAPTLAVPRQRGREIYVGADGDGDRELAAVPNADIDIAPGHRPPRPYPHP